MLELENLEQKYKDSEEEVRSECNHLRKQIASLSKQNRELQTQLLQTRQKLDVKNCEQFTQLKRLEESLKDIRQEVKYASKVLGNNNNTMDMGFNQEEDIVLRQLSETIKSGPDLSNTMSGQLEQAQLELQ